MKNNKVLPLVALISGLLVGCGGGGGGGGGAPAAPTYTWQFVHLYSDVRSSIGAGCSIYSDDQTTAGNVIAAKIADEGFNILYHNADGSVISEETITDIPTTGKVVIDSGLIPDNGYVSLEEVVGGLGNRNDVYMFTVQKDLMTNLVLNVRQQANRSNNCYQGEQFNLTLSDNAVVAVAQSSVDTSYYQSSYVNSLVSGRELSANIPVKAPLVGTKSVLVTAFDTLAGNPQEYEELKHFTFVPSTSIYDSTNPPTNLPSVSMQTVDVDGLNIIPNGFSIDNTSNVELSYENEVYQWQPLYNNATTLSYSSSNLSATSWGVKANGTSTNGSWTVNTLKPFSGVDLNVSIPSVSDFSSTAVDTSCTADFCVSSAGFTPSDFDLQRTHVRGVTSLNYDFYQTIFSPASTNQALMKSSVVTFQQVSTDRIEIGVAKLDLESADSVAWFMEKSMNLQSIVDIDLANYTDVNGSVSLPTLVKNRNASMLSQSVVALENSVN
ncbi:flagellar sheath protein A [Vibrio genomosp. F6]|uniref:flagellar sheath protein A n=1 Tax=Vibrio genomosp. F6 TaxID=723172 RepID=UPI0010BD6473|nr:flagellar sheath protein A [Vibrio genomosp. F6]TKF24073.1 flagellar sheath protein A [Vibrio genomosp. F6]